MQPSRFHFQAVKIYEGNYRNRFSRPENETFSVATLKLVTVMKILLWKFLLAMNSFSFHLCTAFADQHCE